MNQHQQSLFIGIAGNIGSGKSTLTRALAEKFGWKPYFESVDNNPYLSDFYADMKRWSFHLQIYFLSKRFQCHKEMNESQGGVIQDRTIYEDAEIFAKNLFDMGYMSQRDYENYTSLFQLMVAYLKPPDLLIYLRTSTGTLRQQIKQRGRDFEQNIEQQYLEQLNSRYEKWIQKYDAGPLLTIDGDSMDFVHRQQDFTAIAEMVRTALKL